MTASPHPAPPPPGRHRPVRPSPGPSAARPAAARLADPLAGRIPAGVQPGVTADGVRTRKALTGDASNVPHLAAGA